MTLQRRCSILAAVAAACTSGAFADVFSFDGPTYTPGSGIVGVSDPNGFTWQKEGGETGDFVVDNSVFSPLANPLVGGVSTKSLRKDYSAPDSRLGLDLAAPVTSGYVTLQYDVRNNVRTTGGSFLRINVLNFAGIPTGGTTNTEYIQWQPYVQNGGGGAAAQNGFFGTTAVSPLTNGIAGISVMDQCPYQCNQAFSPHLFKEATGANDHWYRVKMWFNMDDVANPGRLLYIGIYDINCGSEILVGEHHVADQASPVWKNVHPLSTNAVRAFQLRGTSSSNQSMWLDNLVIAADPGFVLPPPTSAPIVPSSVLNADAGTQTVASAFALPANVGEMPSLASVGTTVYTLDGNNGLTTWTGGLVSNFTDDALEVQFDTDGTGVLVPDSGGVLHAVANFTGSGIWRDLLRYDPGSGTWVQECDGDATGTRTGNHSASLLTFGGTNHVFHTWTGAPAYPCLNTDGTRTPELTNVGNRWAGACTEAFPHGSTGNQMFILQQTNASGGAISDNSQAYNAIYRVGVGIGCYAETSLKARLSASGRLLPWVTNAADGANVNRHQMEYEPTRNRVWVLRAGGSNQIGIYDIAQDRFGVLKLMNGANPLAMDHADLLLSADGSQMYLMSRGEGAVYAVSTNITFVNTGACLTGGTCALLTSSACASLPGTYLGDNQVCPPPGACCNGSNCSVSFAVTCASGGGTFQGANSVCADYSIGTGAVFEDIVASGTQITTLGDDDSVLIPIGFTFRHYGNAYTDVRVGANGYLSFSGGDGPESWTPAFGTTEPNNIIAGFWTDLSPQVAPGTVHYEVRGTAPNRRLIVQWTRVSQFTTGAPIDENTFQIVLFETSNNAEARFQTLNTPASPYGSGVENADGSRVLTVPQTSIVNGASVQFTQAPNPCAVCRADINNSGTVSVQDIFDFLALYFSNDPRADINNSGTVSVQDIFDFLALYFTGC